MPQPLIGIAPEASPPPPPSPGQGLSPSHSTPVFLENLTSFLRKGTHGSSRARASTAKNCFRVAAGIQASDVG